MGAKKKKADLAKQAVALRAIEPKQTKLPLMPEVKSALERLNFLTQCIGNLVQFQFDSPDGQIDDEHWTEMIAHTNGARVSLEWVAFELGKVEP